MGPTIPAFQSGTYHDGHLTWLSPNRLNRPPKSILSLCVLLYQLKVKLFHNNPQSLISMRKPLYTIQFISLICKKRLSPPLTMAGAWTRTPTTTMTCCTYYYYSMVLLMVFLSSWRSCDGLGTFGFEIHHRFSDPVKGILGVDGLPEKGSADYYVAMAHRDRIIRGRHLASINDQSPLVFAGGNDTYRIDTLGLYDPYSTPQIIIQIYVFS